MPVRALRAAIVAGLIAGVYLVFVVAIRGVPDRLVGWLGGPDGGIARDDGLVLRYQPAQDYNAATLLVVLATLGLALAGAALVALVTGLTVRATRPIWQPRPRRRDGTAVVRRLGVTLLAPAALVVLQHLWLPGIKDVALAHPIRLAVMASLVAGTLLLVVVAAVIRRYGLGNGYGAVIASSWVVTVVPRIIEHPTAGHALGAFTLVIIGGVAMALLRMRVGGGGEASLRVPASGSIPLVIASSVVPQLWSFAQRGVSSGSGAAARWLDSAPHRAGLFAAGIIVLVPLWSFAFSRPEGVAPLAVRAGLAPPRRSVWCRATCLSLVSLLGLGVLAQVSAAIDPGAQQVCEASAGMLVAALVLDMLDDARARGAGLVAVWPLHQAQHAELVRRVLWNAGIDCHLRSCHLRALLGWFGPYAPIDVLVAAKDAAVARDRIGGLYEPQPRKRVSG